MSTRLARWLLLRLAGGPQRDSLIGDLDEQLARGQSSYWYWHQVVSAIFVGVAGDLRDHKLLATGSIILSFAIALAWVEATLALYLWVSETWVNAWVGGLRDPGLWFVFWHPFGGRLCLIWCLGSAASGRLIVQLVSPSDADRRSIGAIPAGPVGK